MSTIRVSLLTIESDSADPALMATIRELLERAGVAAAVIAPAAAPALRVAVPLNEKPPIANPTGRVEGFVAQGQEQSELTARIIKAVAAQPGTTVQAVAQLLLGSASHNNVRRIDMLVGPLVMGGKLVRTNGRLFETAAAAAATAPASPPSPLLPRRKPGQSAPLSDVQAKKDAYNRIVKRFAEDTEYPITKLAEELFGDSTGTSVRKIHLMLTQLVATERLERVAVGEWRAVDDKAKRGRADEDDEDQDEDDTELVSNGQPDENDELEELDVG